MLVVLLLCRKEIKLYVGVQNKRSAGSGQPPKRSRRLKSDRNVAVVYTHHRLLFVLNSEGVG